MQEELQNSIEKILNQVLPDLFKEFSLDFQKEAGQWRISITTTNPNPELANDIREIILSLQHYIRIYIHKLYPQDRTHFLIDVNEYRVGREKKIKNTIPTIAEERVLIEGKTAVLINLSSYERMIVHNILDGTKGISTNSVGFGNQRKLLIMPNSETGAASMDNSMIIDIDKI
jgi:predicted RNA-binding protein Jag